MSEANKPEATGASETPETREATGVNGASAPTSASSSASSLSSSQAGDRPGGLRRLGRLARPRLTKANVLITILALALGFAIQTQVHSTRSSGLENMRQDELVGVLDDVNQRALKLDAETARLQRQHDELTSPDGQQAAVKAAQERLTMLGILAGTVPATGPGITLTMADPQQAITSAAIVDAIEELRDAGAEAMQINNVRIVASTWVNVTATGKVTVDGTALTAPYVITAIGDPHTMSTAMSIPGGVVESLRTQGVTPSVASSQSLKVTALRAASAARYAQPGD